MLKHHPDHNPLPDAAEQFIVIHEAYAILIDPATRLRYNQSLANAWKPKDYAAPYTSTDIKEQQQQARQEAEIYVKDYSLFGLELKKRIRKEMLWGLLSLLWGGFGGGLARIFGLLLIAGGLVLLIFIVIGKFSFDKTWPGIVFLTAAGISYTKGVLKDIREEMEEEEREQHRQRNY